MYDVITVGSAVHDTFVCTDRKSTELLRLKHPGEKVEHIAYPTGAKILIESACFDIGGGATNTATAFSRLGIKTGCVCKVGNDLHGQQILNCLASEKVDFLGSVGNAHTDFSIVLDSRGHDRTILAYKGSSNTIKISDIKLGKLSSKWVYISSLMGASYRTGERIAAIAKKKGSKVAFNPSTYLANKGYHFLKSMLKNTDVLVLNREEAILISREDSIKGMLRKLASCGPETIVITDGNKGAHAYFNRKFYHAEPHKNAKVVETTGAGDAFASSFIAGLIKGKDIEYSLSLAITNAESVISRFGAHNKLLSWKEAESKMKTSPCRVALE